MSSPVASGRHLSKFEKRPKMPRPTALFSLNLMQCQISLQISRVKNSGNVFELSGAAFRLAPPYGVFLVFNISGTARSSNFKMLHNVVLDSLDRKRRHHLLSVGSKSHKRVHFGACSDCDFSIAD